MGISKIIKAIKEYQEVKKTSGSSDQHDFPLQQARRQIESSIIELIDNRIKSYMAREKRKSSQVPAIENALTPKEIDMIDALNSAPNPPANPKQWLISEEPLSWIESYKSWYYGKRIKVIR